MYVRDHRFDQDAMLASVENLIQSGAASGYTRTRLVGHHMDWLFLDPVICNYDLSKFSASVAMDIMRTHPLVIIGGLLRENPSFVPPEQFLQEMHERQASRRSAG